MSDPALAGAGAQPIKSLAYSVAAALPDADVDALTAELDSGSAAWSGTRNACGRRMAGVRGARLAFLALLHGGLRDDPGLWVVATLRSELLTGLLTTGFASLFRNPVAIRALDRAALFQVIEEPAPTTGPTFARRGQRVGRWHRRRRHAGRPPSRPR